MILPLLFVSIVAAQDESPYARWPSGPPTDPDWFPLGVWLQDPELADEYAALGINTFVGLWKGPTEEQLARLGRAGMKVVCSMNKVGREHLDDENIIAWMQVDEPDNRVQGSGSDAGPRATPSEVEAMYRRLREFDPTRPVWLNLGQGVANDEWVGLGARRSDYPGYVAAADIVSFDVYPVTNIRKEDGENYLWYVAKGVRRLRQWGGEIVWNFVECTRVGHATKKPTPAQVRAEVWMSIIAGSRGIVYFCHEFEPDVKPAALLADPVMTKAVARINREVLGYARVLNAPTIEGAVRVSATGDVPVAVLVKRVEGRTWIFAASLRNTATRAEFAVDALDDGAIEVVGEDGAVDVADGRFTLELEPYGVRVLRY